MNVAAGYFARTAAFTLAAVLPVSSVSSDRCGLLGAPGLGFVGVSPWVAAVLGAGVSVALAVRVPASTPPATTPPATSPTMLPYLRNGVPDMRCPLSWLAPGRGRLTRASTVNLGRPCQR